MLKGTQKLFHNIASRSKVLDRIEAGEDTSTSLRRFALKFDIWACTEKIFPDLDAMKYSSKQDNRFFMNSMKSCGDKTGVRKFTIVGSCEMGHFPSLLFIPLFTLPFLHISTFLLYSIKLINAQPTIYIWSSSNIFDKSPWNYSNTWKWLISKE